MEQRFMDLIQTSEEQVILMLPIRQQPLQRLRLQPLKSTSCVTRYSGPQSMRSLTVLSMLGALKQSAKKARQLDCPPPLSLRVLPWTGVRMWEMP
jgi:hypothetical protein